MNPTEIQKKYFSPGTKGYKILNYYFSRYQDLFTRTIYTELDEFIHQIYLNICNISFSDKIKNPEAYIIAAIKIQCRAQLDHALRMKKRQQNEIIIEPDSDEGDSSVSELVQSDFHKTYDNLEINEIFSITNIFKLTLKEQERILFNFLVENVPRKEIAQIMNQKLNTIDTQIRRLRIKFFSYLKKSGYSFEIFNKYDKE